MTKPKRPRPEQRRAAASWFASQSPSTQGVICIAILYILAILLFRDIVFNNMAFSAGGDTAAALSFEHAGKSIEEKEGVDVLWMPYFFSGMPTFGPVAYIPHNVSYVQKVAIPVIDFLFLKGRWTWLVVFYFLGGIFMFLLMRELSFEPPLALFGAVTFMMSPYAIGLAGEGHGSKLMALSYLPLVFWLTHRVFERRTALDFGLLAAALGTLLLTNHMQIVYYALMVIGAYLLYHIVLDARKRPLLVITKTALLAGALLIGLCIASYIYLSVHEYAQYSIRGGGTTGAQGGLNWDYATNWSWNPWEIITLFIPGFFGFQLPFYWGPIEPWTNSTVYVGLLPVLLALVAVIYARNKQTWFFLILTVLTLLISFGRNLAFFYELLFNALPFFNKFRAPAMILHLLAFTIPILGAYGLAYVITLHDQINDQALAKLRKVLFSTLGAVGVLLVLAFVLKPMMFDSLSGSLFLKQGEIDQFRQQYGSKTSQAISRVKELRYDIFWKDYVKFLIFAAAALGTVLAYFYRKIRTSTFTALILVLLSADLFIVDAKLVDPKPNAALEQAFQPDASVSFLKQQAGLFRVLPLGNLFMDNTFAYHGIQSVGGYSPAKLKIYQAILDSCLYLGPNPLNMNVLNMLSVQYLVVPGRLQESLFEMVYNDAAKGVVIYRNPHALPRAFFVDSIVTVERDGDVYRLLNSRTMDVARTAVLQQTLTSPVFPPDSNARVAVKEYSSRRIEVQTQASRPALMVLSEIYYPAGWKAFVDGNESEIYRTNSILRSVVVPAGAHSIVFSFDPPLYRLGFILSNVGWGVALLIVLFGLWRTPAVRTGLRPGYVGDSANPG